MNKNNDTFRIIAINCSGINSKIESFDKILFDRKPSVWLLQETKRNKSSSEMKAQNMINYHVFELKRERSREEGGKGINGGGLAIGALHDLNPVLLRQGDDDVECMTVELTTELTRLRCVVGYGPQISDSPERKDKFWKYLHKEVVVAMEEGTGLVIEIDSNAWAGKKIIPNDPNIQNSNGKLLENFLEQNKNMTVVNSLNICEGAITRKRVTKCLNEKAILDIFMVCEKILPHVTKMHVDEKGDYQLTNFYGKNHKGKVTVTDHAKIELDLNLKFEVQKPFRNEAYNYKSIEGQTYFKSITSNTDELSACFKSNEPFQKQVKKWEHMLRSHVVKSFPKIRSRKRKFCETEIGRLLDARKKLKQNEHLENDFDVKMSGIDTEIAYKIGDKYRTQIYETMGHIKGDDGAISQNGIWKAKNIIIPNDKSSIPVALKDKQNNIISNPEGIKQLCLDEILERLRHRKIHPDLIELQRLKEILCQKRIDIAKHIKSKQWNMKELEKVLNSLQKKKCRDPQGFLNELFKNASAGTDLKQSLLDMLNKTKDTLVIPDIMTIVNIVMIPKPGKKSLSIIQNQHGIFLLSVLRTIIMKMLLKDEYDKIDEFMSDANAGGRKGRRAQDHLFVINGIIYEHARSKHKKQITLGIYDCEQCFDSLWQDEITNDLYEAGIKNDKLALLQKLNETNKVAIKTPHGISQRKVVKQIICQGEPWGPLECSLQIDDIGKESINPQLEPYKYKDIVEIPALGWVDDLITVSESGYKASRLNAFVNAKLAMKKTKAWCQEMFHNAHRKKP